jgi:hypothetical protein
VGLAQLVRFLVVELTHPGSNTRFDMGIVFTANYSFSGGNVPIDSEVHLVTDFVNLKIKSAQSFRCVNRGRVCVRVFIEVSARTCMSIYVCTVFLKKRINRVCQKRQYSLGMEIVCATASTGHINMSYCKHDISIPFCHC